MVELAMLLIFAQVCVTTIKPEVQIARKCLAQVRARVAVADLAFTTSEFARVLLLPLTFGWLATSIQVKSSLFRQGSPFSTRLVSIGALCRSALGVVTARVHPDDFPSPSYDTWV